jgi:hypothetical protein
MATRSSDSAARREVAQALAVLVGLVVLALLARVPAG